jgi:hypothetical protein
MAARLLLVHSPLVGAGTWDLVAAGLAGRGWDVGVPDLTGTVAAGPPYCVRQADVIARSASDRPAILAGHSGAGPLLAAAGAIIGQVRGYIFVDAGLPIPGQTWMDTVPPELAAQVRGMADDLGWLPPWPQWWGDEVLAELIPDPAARRHFVAGCLPLPLAMFEEVHPQAPQWPDAPAAYLQLSEAYEDQAVRARELGWPVAERISHHLAPITHSALVAESLHELLGHLSDVPLKTRAIRSGRRGCDEMASASPEPGAVGLVRRLSRPGRCPEAHAYRADPQVDPYWRAAHGHRPGAGGTCRTSALAALAGWRGAHRGRDRDDGRMGCGSASRSPAPLVRPANSRHAQGAAFGGRARAGRLLPPGPAAVR